MKAISNGVPPVASSGLSRLKYSSLVVRKRAMSPSSGTTTANPGSIPTVRHRESRRHLPSATPISR